MYLQTLEEKKKRKDIPFFGCPGLVILASHADVLRGSSRVPAPISRAGTRDEPLRTSAWEAIVILAPRVFLCYCTLCNVARV